MWYDGFFRPLLCLPAIQLYDLYSFYFSAIRLAKAVDVFLVKLVITLFVDIKEYELENKNGNQN
uniref:Uncharacterized protein n=1 Tax=Arundo donax TaxID=35708 RepID=A0A0A9C3J6_ARUDO